MTHDFIISFCCCLHSLSLTPHSVEGVIGFFLTAADLQSVQERKFKPPSFLKTEIDGSSRLLDLVYRNLGIPTDVVAVRE